jgi:ADP-dependent NAD(P)H-hydrate dehydratase / NAD(P)H-hydrate epimerase
VIKICAIRVIFGRIANERGAKMTELPTAAQMRAIEAAAIASGAVTGLALMERAGMGVVAAVLEEWPDLAEGSQRAVVLCGPGNNGGDGFVVARLLRQRGWAVEVFLYGAPERMPLDARVNYERWLGMGEVSPLPPIEEDRPPTWLTNEGVIVDALFGIGLTRPLSGAALDVGAWCYHHVGAQKRRIVAVDVPSGLCADSGRLMGAEGLGFRADLTVTFHAPKRGHLLGEGPFACGRVRVVDLGLGRLVSSESLSVDHNLLKERPVLEVACGSFDFDDLAKGRESHKYTHGHALILSGPSGRGGAARLSARGALRIGAGVVTLGCPPEAIPENAARMDAVMLQPLADAADLSDALEDQRINALCLGPALGIGAREAGLVQKALSAGRELVLDADALTILSQHPDLFAALHDGCVLTPHAGEFARLFPDIAEKLAAPATKGPAYSKVDAARAAAQRAGCVVLYKGPDTVIAAPDGRCAINSAQYDRAAPWLATAGSGDVLAGFITGLLARGFSPFDAACTGAWLHVECARDFGPGLIAEDLPEQLPAVFRGLGV